MSQFVSTEQQEYGRASRNSSSGALRYAAERFGVTVEELEAIVRRASRSDETRTEEPPE